MPSGDARARGGVSCPRGRGSPPRKTYVDEYSRLTGHTVSRGAQTGRHSAARMQADGAPAACGVAAAQPRPRPRNPSPHARWCLGLLDVRRFDHARNSVPSQRSWLPEALNCRARHETMQPGTLFDLRLTPAWELSGLSPRTKRGRDHHMGRPRDSSKFFLPTRLLRVTCHWTVLGPLRSGKARVLASVVRVPDVSLVVDECVVGNVSPRGSVRQAIGALSWIEIPFSQLPDGELTLKIAGLIDGAALSVSLPLLKRGVSITLVETLQSKRFRLAMSENRATGIVQELLIVSEPQGECER